jgi:predicted hydrocarbon binding protein
MEKDIIAPCFSFGFRSRAYEEKLESTITVHELFECPSFRGEGREAKSHFFEGCLTGVFHKLFKRKVTVRGLNA